MKDSCKGYSNRCETDLTVFNWKRLFCCKFRQWTPNTWLSHPSHRSDTSPPWLCCSRRSRSLTHGHLVPCTWASSPLTVKGRWGLPCLVRRYPELYREPMSNLKAISWWPLLESKTKSYRFEQGTVKSDISGGCESKTSDQSGAHIRENIAIQIWHH